MYKKLIAPLFVGKIYLAIFIHYWSLINTFIKGKHCFRSKVFSSLSKDI